MPIKIKLQKQKTRYSSMGIDYDCIYANKRTRKYWQKLLKSRVSKPKNQWLKTGWQNENRAFPRRTVQNLLDVNHAGSRSQKQCAAYLSSEKRLKNIHPN